MGSIADQYRTVAAGAGWIDRGARGRLAVAGADAASFLHALVTNDVASLAPGAGVYALLLTPQGRIVSDLTIFHRGTSLLAEVPAGEAAAMAARLDQSIFAEDVQVTDVSADLASIAIVGPHAADAVAAITVISPALVRSLPPLAHVASRTGFVANADDAPFPSFQIFLPAAERASAVALIESGGVVPIGGDLAETLRLERARPLFGVDMTTDTIPLEAGLLDRAISTAKGCYVGQEVIIRILHRGGGRVVRRLARLTMDEGAAAARGDAIHAGGRETGQVTSTAYSPAVDRTIALGYVHRDHAEIGQRVRAGSGAADNATVTEFAR